MSETELDLTRFCGSEDVRKYIQTPFSRGDYTYATDGHICIRVPRRSDIPEREKPDVSKLSWAESGTFAPIDKFKLPAEEMEDCSCGSEAVHDCPSCNCVCETCGGKGEVTTDGEISVALAGQIFALKYVRMLFAFDGIEYCATDIPGVAHFRFSGGDILLFGLTGKRTAHIDPPKPNPRRTA